MRAIDAVGLPGRVGVAGSKLAARVAAELPKSPTVVVPGEEEMFLAPLPLFRLSPALDAATTLARWGLTSIGDLARLPESEVASRLGEIGRELHYAARAIDLPAPTRDVKTILTLLRLDIEKTPPGAPVVGYTFVAHPDRPRRAQLSLFGPSAVSPEKLATTIARLVSMLGEDRVGQPVTVDGHLPERHAIGAFTPPPPPDLRRTPSPGPGVLAARVFRPPL